MGEFLVI